MIVLLVAGLGCLALLRIPARPPAVRPQTIQRRAALAAGSLS